MFPDEPFILPFRPVVQQGKESLLQGILFHSPNILAHLPVTFFPSLDLAALGSHGFCNESVRFLGTDEEISCNDMFADHPFPVGPGTGTL